jgi:hypothetical protein
MASNRSKSAPPTCYADDKTPWSPPTFLEEVPRSPYLPTLAEITSRSLSLSMYQEETPWSPPPLTSPEGTAKQQRNLLEQHYYCDGDAQEPQNDRTVQEQQYPDPDDCTGPSTPYHNGGAATMEHQLDTFSESHISLLDYPTCPDAPHSWNYYCDEYCDNDPGTPAWAPPFETGSSFENGLGENGFGPYNGIHYVLPRIETPPSSEDEDTEGLDEATLFMIEEIDAMESAAAKKRIRQQSAPPSLGPTSSSTPPSLALLGQYTSTSRARRAARAARKVSGTRTIGDFARQLAAIKRKGLPSQNERLEKRLENPRLRPGKRNKLYKDNKYNLQKQDRRERMTDERGRRMKEPVWQQWMVMEKSKLTIEQGGLEVQDDATGMRIDDETKCAHERMRLS